MTVKVGSASWWISSAPTSSGPHAAWRSPWSIAPTPNSSARWNSPCATRPTTWPPPSTRPAWRAGKKGVSGLQHRLPRLRPARQVHRLPEPHPTDRQRRGGAEPRLLLLRPLPGRALPLGPDAGPGRRPPKPGRAVVDRPGRRPGAVRAGRRSAAPAGRPAPVRLHLPPRHRGRRRQPASAASRRRARPGRTAGGVGLHPARPGRPVLPGHGRLPGAGRLRRADAARRRCGLEDALRGPVVRPAQGPHRLPVRLRLRGGGGLDAALRGGVRPGRGGDAGGVDGRGQRPGAGAAAGVLGGGGVRAGLLPRGGASARLRGPATRARPGGGAGVGGGGQGGAVGAGRPRPAGLAAGAAAAAEGVGGVAEGPAGPARVCRVERAPDGLSGLPGAGLGRGQRADGGGLQGAGRPPQGGGDALVRTPHRSRWRRCGRYTPAATGYGTPSGTNAVGKTTKASERLPSCQKEEDAIDFDILNLLYNRFHPAVCSPPLFSSDLGCSLRQPVYE